MIEHSPNHPTMRNRSHSGSGWCPRCQTDCVLLDDYERFAPDPYDYEAGDYGDQYDDE